MKHEAEKARREIIEIKQSIFYQRILPSMVTIEHDRWHSQRRLDQVLPIIRRKEQIWQQALKQFDREWHDMFDHHHRHKCLFNKSKVMSSRLLMLLERQLSLMTDQLRDIYQYRMNYYLRRSYVETDEETSYAKVQYGPSLFVDVEQGFEHYGEEQLVRRGPAYVPPYQMFSQTKSSADDRTEIDPWLKQFYAPIQHRLATITSKYHLNIALSMEVNIALQQEFNDHFSLTLPARLRQRSLHEIEIVKSIRRQLQEKHWVLRRTANHRNTFYLTDAHQVQRHVNHQLLEIDYLRWIADQSSAIPTTNVPFTDEIDELIFSINDTLDRLYQRKAIDRELFDRLHLIRSDMHLPSLYFLPDVTDVSSSMFDESLTHHSSLLLTFRRILSHTFHVCHRHSLVSHRKLPVI